jgi:GNAT superfamily N-acetyltransferase
VKNEGTRLRQATTADVETIVRHRRAMFADMGYGDEAARAAMSETARPFIETALRDGSYRGWLVEEAGRVVAGGGVAIVAFQPTPMDPTPRRAWVLNMYTDPECRHRGLAKLLMETMIRWCREQGFKHLSLHASHSGRPLYEQLGFKPTNEMRLALE